MLRNSLIGLSIASLAVISPLKAEEKTKGTYFVGSIGSGVVNDITFAANLGGGTATFDPGFSGEIGVGYDFGNIRTEFTYNSTTSSLTDVDGLDVSSKSFLLSAAYDWRADKKWQPYVGLGIGSSTIDINIAANIGGTAVTAGDDNISTAKFKVGVNYEADENMDLYGEFWGQAYDDFTIGLIQFTDITTSGVSLGIRVRL
jgi:opacity protein-like surface antigen